MNLRAQSLMTLFLDQGRYRLLLAQQAEVVV